MRLGLGAVAASLVACGPLDIGTRFVKSWPVSSAQALQLTVDQTDDLSLAGTELDIPPNTLPANVDEITLELGLAPLDQSAPQAGPVLIWGPAGTSLAAAQFTFPYSADGGSFAVSVAGSGTLLPATPLNRPDLATVTITELTAYEPVLCSNCATDAGPGPDAGPNDGGPEDAGFDAGEDGGFDAGEDAGPGPDSGVFDAGPGPDGGVLDGGTCTTNQECASGVCLNGTCT